MNDLRPRIYEAYVGFRAPPDFLTRFENFSRAVGRNRSDVLRFLLTRCLASYEGDAIAIRKIREQIL
jgi:hypothetical protein